MGLHKVPCRCVYNSIHWTYMGNCKKCYSINDLLNIARFLPAKTTHTDGVMIITLNQNGMIVKFEYCIINQNNELDSILLMMVDRQIE